MRRIKIITNLLFICLFVYLFAAEVSEAQRMIPYNGYIERNGVPVDDEVQMVFYLVENRQVEVNGEADAKWWHERRVEIHQGRFSVVLGQDPNPFEELFFAKRPELFLGIKIEYDGEWRDLNKRQRIRQIPEAIKAQEANLFVVEDKLIVNKNGAILKGVAVQTGHTENIPLRLKTRSENEVEGGDVVGQEMVLDGNSISSNGALQLQAHTDQDVQVRTNLTVDRDVRVNQNLRVDGNLHVQGELGQISQAFSVELGEGEGQQESSTVLLRNVPSDNSFCFLTKVLLRGLNEPDQQASCEVAKNDLNQWELIVRQSEARGECKARCFSW